MEGAFGFGSKKSAPEEDRKEEANTRKAESQGRMQEERLIATLKHGQQDFDMERALPSQISDDISARARTASAERFSVKAARSSGSFTAGVALEAMPQATAGDNKEKKEEGFHKAISGVFEKQEKR